MENLLRLLISFFLKRTRHLENYHIVIAKDKELIDRIHNFRFRIYCDEQGFLDRKDYSDEYENDEYDKQSTHFAILKNSEIIGSVRIIPWGEKNLPTIKEFNIQEKLTLYPHDKIAEISRFIVAPEYRRTLVIVDLYKAIYLYARKNNFEYLIGSIEEWLLRLLQRRFSITVLSNQPHLYFNTLNYAFLLDVKKTIWYLKKRNPILYIYLQLKSKRIQID